MELKVNRPTEILKVVRNLKNTVKVLNEFSCEKNVINFLDNNRKNYSNVRKLNVILNNFEKNTLFYFSDSLKVQIFTYLENHKAEKSIPENELYKIYLYFKGEIESSRLEKLVEKYRGEDCKSFDFKRFVEKNLDKLFTECSFPEYLTGDYPALKELIPIIEVDYTSFEKFDRWQENILRYLYKEDVTKEFIDRVHMSIVKSLDKKLYKFFRKNKDVEIKKIYMEYIKDGDALYKKYNFQLAHGDYLLVYGEFKKNKNRVKKEFYMDKISVYYSKKIVPLDRKVRVKSDKLSSIALVKLLEKKYKLNRIYCLFAKMLDVIKGIVDRINALLIVDF